MKPIPYSIAVILSGVFFTSAMTGTVRGQVNEKAVLRDATGVYKGTIRGGRMDYVFEDGSVSPGTGPTNTGKVKVPVKAGNASTPLVDDELEGDGRARMQGRSKKPRVSRGGKLIKMVTTGEITNPSAEESLEKGKSVGTFQDRGRSWIAKSKGSGEQPFDDGTKWVYSGRKLKGKS